MEIILYETKNDNNDIPKKLENSVSFPNCIIKKETSIKNPINELNTQWEFLTNKNYCYIPLFNRYYFINNMTALKGGIIELSLSVDVLQSYKDKILNSTQLVKRQEYKKSQYQIDNMIPLKVNKNISVIEFDNSELNISKATDISYNFTITLAGGV